MSKNNDKSKLSFKTVFSDIREKLKRITSYKIKENPADKQLEIMIQGEMKMTEKVIKKDKPKKASGLHPELKKFIEEQNERWNNQFELNGEIKEFIKDQNQKWKDQTELNNEIKEFIKDQNQKWDEQNKRWYEQERKWEQQFEFNQQMQKTNQVVLTSIQEILLRLERIESLPTNKKELSDLK